MLDNDYSQDRLTRDEASALEDAGYRAILKNPAAKCPYPPTSIYALLWKSGAYTALVPPISLR